MAKRFFTADWHLSSQLINKIYKRPFNSVFDMNNGLIENCNSIAEKDDIVIHVGDFLIYGNEKGEQGLKTNPSFFLKKIKHFFPTFPIIFVRSRDIMLLFGRG